MTFVTVVSTLHAHTHGLVLRIAGHTAEPLLIKKLLPKLGDGAPGNLACGPLSFPLLSLNISSPCRADLKPVKKPCRGVLLDIWGHRMAIVILLRLCQFGTKRTGHTSASMQTSQHGEQLTIICGVQLNVVCDVVHKLLDIFCHHDLLCVLCGHQPWLPAASTQLKH